MKHFKFKNVKEKIESYINKQEFSSDIDEIFPHEYDANIKHISSIIEQAVDRYPERLSSFLNINSNKKSVIMKEMNRRLDKLHKNENEMIAFSERFNKFIRTIELTPVRVY